MFDGLKAFWKAVVAESKKQDHEENPSPAEERREKPEWARDPDPDSPASLTITQNEDDHGFEPIIAWLQADSRVTEVGTDDGRHYTVPDGDDLGEWYAIRIHTIHKHRESLKVDLQKMVDNDVDGMFKVEYF